MSSEKRQKTMATPSEDKDGTSAQEPPVAAPGTTGAPARWLLVPADDKPHSGFIGGDPELTNDWVRSHLLMDHFPLDPSTSGLNTYAWDPVWGGVAVLGREIRDCGLVPWDKLPPAVREKMCAWSPVARQLWESDFHDHHEAPVRAWIWHYLDDTLLSFSDDKQTSDLLACTSPVWTYVQGLHRELDVLRSGRPELGRFTRERHRVQYHFWRRLTDSLVREGLGLRHFTTAADLVPHFKRSLRLLVTDGQTKIPDYPTDVVYKSVFARNDPVQALSDSIKSVAHSATTLQEYQHGVIGSLRVRFTPIGSDQLWGFSFDGAWMDHQRPCEIPPTRPGEPLPLVQLVSDPMLVISGVDGWSYEENPKLWPGGRMQVVAPWTFGGEEAEKHTYPGWEKGWQERRIKKIEEEEETERREAAQQALASSSGAAADTPKEDVRIGERNEEEAGRTAGPVADEPDTAGKKRARSKKVAKGRR